MPLTYPRYDARDFERRWQTRLTAAADDERRFRAACGSDASLPGTKPVRLGTPARGGPFRGRVAHSIQFLGRSQSGRQTGSDPILAAALNPSARGEPPF